ncbi:MAG TPA: PHP domain-containing protein [Vicinamibacterales bacterium]|nr:PHP domain-containing protein [Vicinamibacterales bacterium]
MIDLHLHTTASDGRSTPEELVRRAAGAGITTLAVTDHDTTAGVAPARAAAAASGITVVTGIEITSVHRGRDVHMLGYFIDESDEDLGRFLVAQRADRRRRIEEMLDRLAGLGVVLDRAGLMSQAEGKGKAIGRPVIARALVAGGHAKDVSDAFDRFLSPDRPAFVARHGASPAEVVAIIRKAGGVSSLAHPLKYGLDDLIPSLAADGLDAIEAFHPDHDEPARARYQQMASAHGLLVSGGSDDHGPGADRPDTLGTVTCPAPAFVALAERAAFRHT